MPLGKKEILLEEEAIIIVNYFIVFDEEAIEILD